MKAFEIATAARHNPRLEPTGAWTRRSRAGYLWLSGSRGCAARPGSSSAGRYVVTPRNEKMVFSPPAPVPRTTPPKNSGSSAARGQILSTES